MEIFFLALVLVVLGREPGGGGGSGDRRLLRAAVALCSCGVNKLRLRNSLFGSRMILGVLVMGVKGVFDRVF